MTNLVQACSIMSESLSERVMAGFSSLVCKQSKRQKTKAALFLFLNLTEMTVFPDSQ